MPFELFTAAVLLCLLLVSFRRLVVLPRQQRERILHRYLHCHAFTIPALPEEFNHTSLVESRITPNRFYQINLFANTCSCRLFKNRRSCYEPHDIRRLCRHLRKQLADSGAIARFDPLTRAIIRDRVRDRCYHRLTLCGTEMAFGYHPKSYFLRVFTRTRAAGDPLQGPFTGPYDKFVLNTSQENWIYGAPPPGDLEIIRYATRFLEQITESERVRNKVRKKNIPSASPSPEE